MMENKEEWINICEETHWGKGIEINENTLECRYKGIQISRDELIMINTAYEWLENGKQLEDVPITVIPLGL